jgi:hypothetical protein
VGGDSFLFCEVFAMTVVQLVGAVSLITAVGGGVYVVEDRYAHKRELQSVAWKGLERDYEDRIEVVQMEIRYLESLQSPTSDQRSRLQFLRERLRVYLQQLEKLKGK